MKIFVAVVLRFAAGLALVAAAACTDPAVKKANHLKKGDALLAQNKPTEAVLEYKNALKIDRRFGEARYHLAGAYEKSGNPQAAEEYLRAAELLPDRADVQLKAASLLLKATQFEQARKHADLAIKADPKSMEARIVHAYALAGIKDIDGAVKELEDVITSNPDDSRPQITIGALQAAGGNLAEAEAAFKKAVDVDPTSAPAKLSLAYFYWAGRRGPDAEKILLELLSTDQANVGANRLLALFYLASNRVPEAEAPLLRLVNAKDARATLMLAEVYVKTRRPERARPLYESLAQVKATRQIAVSRLATLDYAAGRHPEAHAALDEEIKQSPKNVALLALKAHWLLLEDRKEEALTMAKQAVAADAQSAQAQFTLGRAYAANRNEDLAMAAFKETLRLSPNMTAAQLELSRALLATGKADQALQHAQAARKAAPGNPAARFNVARAMLAKGDTTSAEAEVKTLGTQFPESAAVHALYGQVLLARSDGPGASREFDRALALDPADVDALIGRMVIDLSQKRPQDARARVERAIAKAPNNGAVLVAASRFERTDGNHAAAEKYLRKAIEVDPTNLDVYGLLARLYISQNRLADGKKELEEFVRRKPEAVGARTMIGMIQQAQGNTDEAVKTYSEIVKETSTAAVASNNLAYLYVEAGQQLDRAVELAQNAKQQMPDNADVSDTLGWAYYKKGMPELAVKALEFSVKKDPQNPIYLVHLGLAYAKMGNQAKAKASLTQALKLKPNVSGADEARAVLASLPG